MLARMITGLPILSLTLVETFFLIPCATIAAVAVAICATIFSD